MASSETLRKRWGRRKGRPLNSSRQKAMDNILQDYGLPVADVETSSSHQIDPMQWFSSEPKEIWMEIGFGNGEHVSGMASAFPEMGIIGCEPFVNGVSALCRMIEEEGQKNIRIWPDDAHVLMDRLLPDSLDQCYVLFPDPWPKARHHKRRFIRQENLDVLAELIKPGGLLQLATDHPDLAEWMLEQGLQHPSFDWMAQTCEDWQKEPEGWIKTRYQEKAAAQGRPSYFLAFRNIKKD